MSTGKTSGGNKSKSKKASKKAKARRAKSSKAKAGNVRRKHPIADKLIKTFERHRRNKVVDLSAFKTSKEQAEELQKTVASPEDMAHLHPVHAMYTYVVNQTSVLAEALSELEEMDRFVDIITRAEEEYRPSAPPMSPLTKSFYTNWAFFDACVGLGRETIGTVILALGPTIGMDGEMLRLLGLLQQSRMGLYIHEGHENDLLVMRELVTDEIYKVFPVSGYRGARGELWYVRLLPPPLPGMVEHMVFTTPYVLIPLEKLDWLAYFGRNLAASASETERLFAQYEYHMKFGPSRYYWLEFVFQAYVNYQSDAIFLTGVPDVPESLPHAP